MVHALAIGVIGTLASIRVPLPGVRPRQVLAYIALSAPPVPTELLLPPPEALKPPEPPPQPEPEPSIETPVLEEKPAPPEPEPPVPEVVRPAPKPDVRVGLFAKDSQPAAAALPPREVVPAGFDSNPAAAANLNLRVSSTGAFDAAAGAAARPGTAKGLVAATGFDQRTAVVSSAGRAIAATGFQAAQAVAATPPQRAVHQSGFGDVQPAPTERPAAAKPVGPTTPVEVLFKPLPAYTDEARAQHIEGEIILEVDFMASGEVHVVRVVHGLGHGLDDMAVEAATHIRFKPALEQGRPIDFRTDVRILFRLA